MSSESLTTPLLSLLPVFSNSSSPTSSFSTTSSSSESSPMLTVDHRRCVVCHRPAFTNNYGVLSCDACKMFFRRIVTLNREYECNEDGRCRERVQDPKLLKCKGCRYQMCLRTGMTFQPNFLELTNSQDSDVATVIGTLLYLDGRRSKSMKMQFTDEDFTLMQILEQRKMRLKNRRNTQLTNHDWSFFGIYTSVEFLMSLEFMSMLSSSDKRVLLKNFCVKASLLASAMRAMKENRDRLMTVDGRDVYPDDILKLEQFSKEFLNRIRSLLVVKLIDLKMTQEEFVLINVVFFCNPALPLSIAGQEIITNQQQFYTSVLLQYCNIAYGKHGPSRFANLVALFDVINKNFEDVQAMTVIFRMSAPGVKYRQLVAEVI